MESNTVASSRTEMSEVMLPNHANLVGKVFGGSVLSLIDVCAYATSSRFAGGLTVTASFDRVDFHEPIAVGELVTLVGQVSYVGRTSVETTIEVYAENLYTGNRRHTNTARVTMVAVDEAMKPKPVPRLLCETREEKIHFLEGRVRRELRTRQSAERDRLFENYHSLPDGELDRLVGAESLL